MFNLRVNSPKTFLEKEYDSSQMCLNELYSVVGRFILQGEENWQISVSRPDRSFWEWNSSTPMGPAEWKDFLDWLFQFK